MSTLPVPCAAILSTCMSTKCIFQNCFITKVIVSKANVSRFNTITAATVILTVLEFQDGIFFLKKIALVQNFMSFPN